MEALGALHRSSQVGCRSGSPIRKAWPRREHEVKKEPDKAEHGLRSLARVGEMFGLWVPEIFVISNPRGDNIPKP